MNSQHLLAASVTSNTHSVYTNALHAFDSFRSRYNLPKCWPSPVEHLSLFISYCFGSGCAPSTITAHLSGLSFHHKLFDLQDPTTCFIIKKLLEGCRRTRPRHDIRAPITEPLLAKICAVLPEFCWSHYESTLFAAAYTIAYHGLMRVSEVVFTNQLQANRPLLESDVWLGEGHNVLFISIRVSKTNHTGPPTLLRIPIADKASSSICCVTAVKHYMQYRPAHSKYFFCHQNSYPLTRSQFTGVLSKAVQRLGLPTHLYASHSFRIGRASDLAAKGYSSETIKHSGRWNSGAVNRYIRL